MQLGELLTGVWQFAYQNEVQSTNQGQQNLAYFLGYQNMSKQNAQSHSKEPCRRLAELPAID